MNGLAFLQFLRNFYQNEGQVLFNQYFFNRWLNKSDGTTSFQFKGCSPKKSIPQNWLIHAKNQLNNGAQIDRDWFRQNFQVNDCRVSIALWLLDNH
jgi:hypothetical protein